MERHRGDSGAGDIGKLQGHRDWQRRAGAARHSGSRQMRHLADWLGALAGVTVILAVIDISYLPYDPTHYARQRRSLASSNGSPLPGTVEAAPIEIAVVWPPAEAISFKRGVHLAVTQINDL